MSYWKGLFVAAVFDLVLLAGSGTLAPPVPTVPSTGTRAEPGSEAAAVARLHEIDRRVDSLTSHLQTDSLDVDAMEMLAELYQEQGWHQGAIGPLARALEIDPGRWSLWVALDAALAATGRDQVTDEELIAAARGFVEVVRMWGHGC